MRTDPFTGVCYELKAGQYITLFVRNAVFPTLSSLRFDITFLGEQLFFGDLLNGYLPYQGWSLTILDSAFHELGRYTWQQCQVTRVSFPDLENASASIVSLSVELFLTGLTEGSQEAQATASSAQISSRKDPVAVFGFRFLADGLEDVEWSVSKIAAFSIGLNIHENLVVSVSPEAYADPFRDWLRDGNQPKSASLDFLGADLRSSFRMKLMSLQVISVNPPLTTFGPGPATVQLSYGAMSFELTASGSPVHAVPVKHKPKFLTGLGGSRRGL